MEDSGERDSSAYGTVSGAHLHGRSAGLRPLTADPPPPTRGRRRRHPLPRTRRLRAGVDTIVGTRPRSAAPSSAAAADAAAAAERAAMAGLNETRLFWMHRPEPCSMGDRESQSVITGGR